MMTPSLVKWTLEKIASLLLFTSTKCADLILMKRLSCAAVQGPRKLRIDRGTYKAQQSDKREGLSCCFLLLFTVIITLSKSEKAAFKKCTLFRRRMRKNYFSTRCPQAKPLLIIVLNDCILFLCVVMNW